MGSRNGVIDDPHLGLEWPAFVPYGAALVAVAAAVIGLIQRDALLPPNHHVLFALVAVSPWLLEHLTPWIPPRPVMALLGVGGVLAMLAGDPATFDFAPFILVVICAEVAATGTLRDGLFALVTASAGMIGLDLADQFDGSLIWLAGIFSGWGMGHFMQVQVRLLAQTRARQADLAERAATDERQRIAREVHDVIAHSLSVTLLHLTGARHALESGEDPKEVVEALRDAERLGRHAMVDIRRTVGLLQPDAGQTTPLPGIPEIAELADDLRAAGLAVACRIDGDLAEVSAATGLGLYRIAQESLANVAKHAPDSGVDISVGLAGSVAHMLVRNGPVNGAASVEASTGHGVRGMSERARLLGGTLAAGVQADEWVVDVSVPVGAADEPSP